MTKQSQEAAILDYLKSGKTLTPLQALRKFHCFRLGARIWNLKRKKRCRIKTEIVREHGKHFARYSLA